MGPNEFRPGGRTSALRCRRYTMTSQYIADRLIGGSTLFDLLVVAGMRISEALPLRLEDMTADGWSFGRPNSRRAVCCRFTMQPEEPWMSICLFACGLGSWIMHYLSLHRAKLPPTTPWPRLSEVSPGRLV